MDADSVVLERTRCYGTCPAYRLSVTRQGVVSFQSRNPGEDNRRFVDTIAVDDVGAILVGAEKADFLALPDTIAADPHFCPSQATDYDTAIVTLYLPHQTKRVEDYHGCFWAPVALRELEDRIDTHTRSQRWIRRPKWP